MCAPRNFHYEIRGACLKGKKFETITQVLRAVARKAAEWGVEHNESVFVSPHVYPGAYGEIVKVTTVVREDTTEEVI